MAGIAIDDAGHMPGQPAMANPEAAPSGEHLASRIRESKAEDGLRAPVRSPRATTARCTSGGALLKDAAALSSTPLVLINSSTAGSTAGTTPPPLVVAELHLASLMRAIRAAEALRAVLSSPRESTIRWTSGGHVLRSLAAPSSTRFSLRN